jgi:hypothetical protein
MSCTVSHEKLDDTMKQLIEQQTSLANDIKLKDLELGQLKESYMKVLGAIEIVQILNKEILDSVKDSEKIDIAEVT